MSYSKMKMIYNCIMTVIKVNVKNLLKYLNKIK